MQEKGQTEVAVTSAVLQIIASVLDGERLQWGERPTRLLMVGELKTIVFVSVDPLQPGLFSQDELDRWHAGCIQYANAMCTEVGGYNSQTKNQTTTINLWNSFIQFLNGFPDTISFPNTPDNQRKANEGHQAQQQFIGCFNRGTDTILNNLERDVVAFDSAVTALCLARQNFENSPSSANNLPRIQAMTTAAQTKLDEIKPYVVLDNQRSRDLFVMEERAFNRALPCARIDEIDRLRQEYIQNGFSTVPARGSFQRLGSPWNFGEYSYALISPSVQSAAQRIVANGSTSITSAYRNPNKELALGGTVNSRHCYGDAIDFATSDKDSFVRVARVACGEGPSWVEPPRMSSYNHVHADWRPGGTVPSSYCVKPQVPTSFVAARVSANQVRINWDDHLPSSLDGVKVERSINGTNYSEIAVIKAGVKTYTDNGLVPGTYHYRACAYNDLAGNSAYTLVSTVILPPPLVS